MTETPSRRRSRLNRTQQPAAEEPVYAFDESEPEEEQPVRLKPLFAPQETEYNAYYSREGAEQETDAQPSFAPPPSMHRYAAGPQDWEAADEAEAANVYRPREVTWAEEDRDETLAESELGYQVQEDEPMAVRRERRPLRIVLLSALVLALLSSAAWLLRDRLSGLEVFAPEETQDPAAFVTPEPVRAYEAAPAASVADSARSAISQLAGTLEMETYLVTDGHIVTRNRRADGSHDFYLFTSEGRLLCYFEGLAAQDMMPQAFGGFYVRQAPWLVKADGSALIRTSDVEAAIRESVFLHPMYRGWAVVESMVDGNANYVNAEGQLMSSLWFSRTFPFTGDYTLAYVDTGSTAGAEDRYLLYIIAQDGGMTRWMAAGDMTDAVAAIGGMAYLKDGALYRLPDIEHPVLVSPEIVAYPDCGAMVIKDPQSGQYGLFVNGEQHYAFAYDAIHPLESQLDWQEKTLGNAQASLTIRTVSPDSCPLPLSHSFVLEKDGQLEYVALSAQSSYPIRLDGEF